MSLQSSFIQIFISHIKREFLINFRSLVDVISIISFMILIVTLFVLGIGPFEEKLRLISNAIFCIGLILAIIPSLEKGIVKNYNNEIFKDHFKWGQNLIYIDSKNGLSKDLTVYENLKTWSDMRGWKTSDDDLKKALDSVEMLNHKNLYISQCSEGLKKRAALSRLYLSLLFDVEFWLLDEPTNELDQKSIILFNKLIQRFLENKGTVLLACHELKLFDFNYELLNLDLLKK